MTHTVTFILEGADAEIAAPDVVEALTTAFGETPTLCHADPAPTTPHRDLATGLNLATLIATLPGSVLAVADLVERRKRADQSDRLLQTLRALSKKYAVTIRLELLDRTRTVAELTPDDLLALADAVSETPKDRP